MKQFFPNCGRWRGGIGIVLVMLLTMAANAASLRVTTWNLQPKSGAEAGINNLIAEAANSIKELNPDVILLQSVPEYQSCEELVKALQPAQYEITVFSSFRDAQTGELSRRQLAILSKDKASSTSSEPWKSEGQGAVAPGGYAFASVSIEGRDVGLFSVLLSEGAGAEDRTREGAAQELAREEAVRQLTRKMESLRNPEGNATPAMIVAGDLNTTADSPALSGEMTVARLERAGFASVFSGLPSAKRMSLLGSGRPDAKVDYIFIRNTGPVGNVRLSPVTFTEHCPVTADLDLGRPVVAAATPPVPVDPTTPDAGPPTGSLWETFVAKVGVENTWWLAGLLLCGLTLVIAGAWMLARPREPLGMETPPARTTPAGGHGVSPSPRDRGDMMIVGGSTQTGSSTGGPVASSTVVRVESSGHSQSRTRSWQRRAEEAEHRAENATAIVREGLMPHLRQWFREKFTQRLISDRSQLLEAQRMAAMKMQAVDERLTRVEMQIQQRIRDYEKRIDELGQELSAARDENRELIRSKIAQVRADMDRERARLVEHERGR